MTKAASLESLVSQLLKTAETIEVAARALEAALAPSVGAVVAVGEALYPLLNRPKEGPLGPLPGVGGGSGLPSSSSFPWGKAPSPPSSGSRRGGVLSSSGARLRST